MHSADATISANLPVRGRGELHRQRGGLSPSECELLIRKEKIMKTLKKVFILILANLFVFFSLGNVMGADDYPNKPINWIISMAPGGAADQMARMLAPEMEKVLKTSIVIQYKVGGGGTIGYSAIAKEKPDGYTMGTYATSYFSQQYVKTGGAMIGSFDFIANFVNSDGCIAVLGNSPFKNLKDLFDYALKNPQVVTIANSGTGASGHLPAAAIERAAKVKFTHVPNRG